MNHGDSKLDLKSKEKEKMLDELESLSRLLDEELDEDDDTPKRPIPEDIPVLKSFVDDVPVLSERHDQIEPPAPVQKSDSVDQDAGAIRTVPNTRSNGRLDDSWLDKDPLEISAAVRQHKQQPEETPAPAPEAPPLLKPEPPTLQAAPTAASAKPTPAPSASKPPKTEIASTHKPAEPTRPVTAASATQPLNRFQSDSKSENPFLPRSTLEKIRENHAYDASAELRKLIQNNPLQKLSFDLAPNSREYQQLRQKASTMINEVIRANMPRLEAELRLKLEQEVDRMFKELKKK